MTTLEATHMQLRCKHCGSNLTGPVLMRLWHKSPESIPSSWPNDRQAFSDPGTAVRAQEPYVRNVGDGPTPHLGHTPIDFVHPDDLTDTLRLTEKQGYLNGCCGLDGCDGPNQLCQCGAEVGTLLTDCWTLYGFVPQPAETVWVNAQRQTNFPRRRPKS